MRKKIIQHRTLKQNTIYSPATTPVRVVPSSSPEASPVSPSVSPSTTTAAASVVLLPVFRFGGIVHKESIKREGVGKHEVADVVSTDGEGIEGSGLAVAGSHFNGLEMGVHLHIHAYGEI